VIGHLDALRSDPRIQKAVAEFTALLSARFPSSTFVVSVGDDPDEVVDLIIDRLVTLQVEDELPLYVIPVRTPERASAVRARESARWSADALPLSALG
jgi:hypothetical protein